MAMRSAAQDKAIANFANKGFSPQLSTHPVYRFRNNDSGEIIERHIDGLVSEYNADHKEALKEKARAKREEKAKSNPMSARRFS